MLNFLPKWHEPLALLREVGFHIIARPGVELAWGQLPAEFQHLRKNVVEVPLIDISGTDIRRRVRAGESIDGLTPPPVVQYIRQNGLYR
jgi:nicotinate-nucleotide adenylyltransferase